MYHETMSWLNYYKRNASNIEKALVNIAAILTLIIGIGMGVCVAVFALFPEVSIEFSYEYFGTFRVPETYYIFLVISCIAYVTLGCLMLRLKNWISATVVACVNILLDILYFVKDGTFPSIAGLILYVVVAFILKKIHEQYRSQNSISGENLKNSLSRRKISKVMMIIIIVLFILQIIVPAIIDGINAVNEVTQSTNNYEGIDELVEQLE